MLGQYAGDGIGIALRDEPPLSLSLKQEEPGIMEHSKEACETLNFKEEAGEPNTRLWKQDYAARQERPNGARHPAGGAPRRRDRIAAKRPRGS